MSKKAIRTRAGSLLLPVIVLAAAAIALIAHIIWDSHRDAEREEEHGRTLSAIRREMKESRNSLRKARTELEKAGDKPTACWQEKQKLQAVAAGPLQSRGCAAKDPLEMVVDHRLTETEQDEALMHAMFGSQRIEKHLSAERHVATREEAKTAPAGAPAERTAGPGVKGTSEHDARERAAAAALYDAIAFEYDNPNNLNANKEKTAARYREIADNFPDTTAARRAAKYANGILKREK